MKLNSKYSMPDYFRLAWSLFLTKIFFANARLIRQPTRIRGFGNMSVGKNFTTGQYCRIEAGNGDGVNKTLIFGNNIQINDRCHIASMKFIAVGDDVLLGSNVFITDHDHGDLTLSCLLLPPAARPLVCSPVVIEENVWIGENSIVLKGVTIGRSSVIAAGCVVTRSVPPFSLVAGVPGRVLKTFHPAIYPELIAD